MKSRTLSVSIDSVPAAVYEFVSNPENLPKWARAFCRSVRKSGKQWIVDTPDGPVGIRFVDTNAFGILDHYVSPAPDVEIYIPMGVVANGSGSEVLLTVFQSPVMSDAKFAEDVRWVERDLRTLKSLLEAKR